MSENLFIRATRQKLRFKTPVGRVGVEDLWDLSLEQLNTLAKQLNKAVKEVEEPDFLAEEKPKSVEEKLSFDVVLYILNQKKTEKDAAMQAAETKRKKARLLDALARKQDASIDAMSEDELKKAIEEL